MANTPRVLRLTYELHVPVGLSKNIYADRVERAAEAITAAVRSLTATAFPWADQLRVRSEWSYVWRDEPETYELPATEMNSPTVASTKGFEE